MSKWIASLDEKDDVVKIWYFRPIKDDQSNCSAIAATTRNDSVHGRNEIIYIERWDTPDDGEITTERRRKKSNWPKNKLCTCSQVKEKMRPNEIAVFLSYFVLSFFRASPRRRSRAVTYIITIGNGSKKVCLLCQTMCWEYRERARELARRCSRPRKLSKHIWATNDFEHSRTINPNNMCFFVNKTHVSTTVATDWFFFLSLHWINAGRKTEWHTHRIEICSHAKDTESLSKEANLFARNWRRCQDEKCNFSSSPIRPEQKEEGTKKKTCNWDDEIDTINLEIFNKDNRNGANAIEIRSDGLNNEPNERTKIRQKKGSQSISRFTYFILLFRCIYLR